MQLFFFVDNVMIKGDGFTLQEQSWDSPIDSTQCISGCLMLESHLRKLMVPTTDLKWINMLSGRFRSYPNANPECDPEPLILQLMML